MLGLLVILSLAVAGVRSFSCPEYDFITRHQDVANVNRFFMCLNGNINILNCEEGLYFDSITERCESLEWLAKAIVCDPNVDSYFPHEIYCSKYYHCVHGELIVQNCPEGTEFNPTLNLCDWPSASGCSSKTTDSPLVNTTTPVPTTMSPNTTINFTMTATPTDYPPTANTTLETNTTTAANTTIMDSTSEQPTTINPPSICPQNSSTITIVADKDDCQKFYICFNGNASPYQCDDGEEFNSDSLVCEPISENGCTASKTTTYSPITNTTVTDQTTENPTSQQPSPICDPNDNTLNIVPDPEDCFIFYVCFMGIPTEYTCDKTLNLEFDPVSKKCVEISDTGCTASKNNTTMTSY